MFENLRVEEITSTSAVVLFETRVPTTCEVEYGRDGMELSLTATDPSMGPDNPLQITHRVPLIGLAEQTTYRYRARATDEAGDTFRSDESTFDTLEDTTPPNMLNVARLSEGASVTAVSSNFGGGSNDSTWGIHNALDGDFGTEWATAGDGDNAEVTVDLGQTRSVAMFGFHSRRMLDGTSIIERVQLVIDGGATTLGPYDTPDPMQLYTFPIDPPVSARTVRIEALQTTGGNTGAREIQLFEGMP